MKEDENTECEIEWVTVKGPDKRHPLLSRLCCSICLRVLKFKRASTVKTCKCGHRQARDVAFDFYLNKYVFPVSPVSTDVFFGPELLDMMIQGTVCVDSTEDNDTPKEQNP